MIKKEVIIFAGIALLFGFAGVFLILLNSEGAIKSIFSESSILRGITSREIEPFSKGDITLNYKNEIEITPYLNEKTELTDFSWGVKTEETINEKNETILVSTKEFYPLATKIVYPLTEFHWLVNKLETGETCTQVNQYSLSCSKEVLNFSTFESKNKITNKTITENKDKNGTILSYLISYYGLIWDLDPAFELIYNTASNLIYKNITEGSTYGARLHAPVLYMDFNKAPEYLTTSSTIWTNYSQDNSVYNNYGTLTITYEPWIANTTIKNGIPAAGDGKATVFYKDSSWYLIFGTSAGTIYGYVWNGTGWQLNSTINASLPIIESFSTPSVFYKDESWYLISGASTGGFYGYVWNGTDWLTNLTINASLPDIGIFSAPDVFYKDSSWYLLSGSGQLTSLNLFGFVWNGTDWLTNLTINSTSIVTPYNFTTSVFQKDSSWYMITGEHFGTFRGYVWNGTGWSVNTTINASLPDIGLHSAPEVFNMSTDLYLISGAQSGSWFGYNWDEDNNISTAPTYNSSCTAFSGSGGCYEFDGVNDYIVLNSLDDLSTYKDGWTLYAWVKHYDGAGYTEIFGGYGLMVQTTTNKLTTYDGGYKYSTQAIQDGVWTQVVATCQNNNLSYYINGTLDSSQTGTCSYYDASRVKYIGSLTLGNTYVWNGSIDDARIYDRALSLSEINTLYSDATSQGKYAKSGDFKSGVFYNSTSQYWNTTFFTANSSGQGIDLTDANLVSYWKLNENYQDSKGSNHGTCTTGTCPLNATGFSSDAMRFDGTNDFINVTDNPSLDFGTNNFTISLWMNVIDMTNTRELMSKGIGTGVGNWRLYTGYIASGGCIVDKPCFSFKSDSLTTYGVGFSSASSINTWYNLIVTRNGTTISTYTNGVLEQVATPDTTTFGNAASLYLGASAAGGGTYGMMDEVIIYNKTLTQSEIRNLYHLGLSQLASTNISLQTRTATSYNLTDSGLVSQWSFNTNESGNATDDMGVSDGICYINQCPTWNESYGVVGGGYNFNGTNNFINATDIDALDGITAMTVSSWIKLNALATDKAIITKWDHQTQTSWALQTGNSASDELQMFTATSITDAGTTNGVTNNSDLSANKWYHVTMVYNGSGSANSDKLKIYVDGVEKTVVFNAGYNIPASLPSANSTVKIGRFGGSITRYFNGSIDEVRIYNRSLSASEVLDLYNMEGSVFSDWTGWSGEKLIIDGETNKTNGFGNFYQFKTYFKSNDTEVSPYLLNHSAGFGGGGDITPPYFTTIPANQTINNGVDWAGVDFDAEDADTGISSYSVNDGSFSINSTGYLDNSTTLLAKVYSILVTAYDGQLNSNSTIYVLTVSLNSSIKLSLRGSDSKIRLSGGGSVIRVTSS